MVTVFLLFVMTDKRDLHLGHRKNLVVYSLIVIASTITFQDNYELHRKTFWTQLVMWFRIRRAASQAHYDPGQRLFCFLFVCHRISSGYGACISIRESTAKHYFFSETRLDSRLSDTRPLRLESLLP